MSSFICVISSPSKRLNLVFSSEPLSFEEKHIVETTIGSDYTFLYGLEEEFRDGFFKDEIVVFLYENNTFEELFQDMKKDFVKKFEVSKSKYYKYK